MLNIFSVTTKEPHSHSHKHTHPHADHIGDPESFTRKRIWRLAMFLEAHFGEVELHEPVPGEEGDEATGHAIIVTLDEAVARIDLDTMVRFDHVARLP